MIVPMIGRCHVSDMCFFFVFGSDIKHVKQSQRCISHQRPKAAGKGHQKIAIRTTPSALNARQNACNTQACCSYVQAHPQKLFQALPFRGIPIAANQDFAVPHQFKYLADVENIPVDHGPHDRVRGHGADKSINAKTTPLQALTDIKYAWCRAQRVQVWQ